MSSVAEMLKDLKKSGALEKIAAQGGLAMSLEDEATVKLAEDIYAAGRIMGHGVIAGILEKLAAEPESATGAAAPSQGNESHDQSTFKRVSEKIMRFKGGQTGGSAPGIPGSTPNVLAEAVAPPQAGKPNPPEKKG